ncbi:MAG TPA: PAS domain S-box protein [Terriglobales bacterium]|jgi:PAS domain S-box-containing protein|nr:PAS domain S-box protein [Terriglobales bacterium]
MPRHQGWCCILLLLALAACLPAQTTSSEKNVLFLYSFSRRDTFDALEYLKATVRSRFAGPVNFNVEYLDSTRFRVPGYEKSLSDNLRDAYAGRKLDIVVVGAFPALRFALDHRDEMFPHVPIVFILLAPDRLPKGALWPGVTGVTIPVDVRGTINLGLRLNPGTRNIAVISGASEFEQFWLKEIRRELADYKATLNVIELVGTPPDQLLKTVSALPPHTIAIFDVVPSEASQPVMGTYELMSAVAKLLPTYCIHNYCLDYGAIGGSYPDANEQILNGGQLIARVLSGEAPENIPVVRGSIDRAQVDWRQLRRWHIPESRLPAGTVVLYRQPSFWERDRRYIVAALVVILAQSLLILALLWQRARKRKAEAVLRESEERFRVMADTTPSMIWMCDQRGNITYLNSRRAEFTGPNAIAEYSDVWTSYLHPDDRKNVMDVFTAGVKDRKPFSVEYRLRRWDGVYRWIFDVASPRLNGDGTFAGFIGSAIDITDQKLAQEALENVSGRLIEAQEKERTRIARDLHDDICQRLALLSMELEQANRNGSPPATKQRLEQIRQHCAEIAGDVQSLSHQLHSSKLDYLGIVAAIRGFCKEFEKQHEVQIEFKDESVPTHLSKDLSLCLFRVTQEALHNAVKYSGAPQFSVELQASASDVQLTVSDRGRGFDVEEAKANRGLGLVSMQERVHLVRGRLLIDSRPGAGTRIVAIAPLTTGHAEAFDDVENDQTKTATGTA